MIPLEEVASTMARNRARPPTPPRRRGSPSRLLETNLAEAAGATNGGGGGGGILKKNRSSSSVTFKETAACVHSPTSSFDTSASPVGFGPDVRFALQPLPSSPPQAARHPLTPHQQRRRAALLADSPERFPPPPPPPPPASMQRRSSRRRSSSVAASLDGLATCEAVDGVEVVVDSAESVTSKEEGDRSRYCGAGDCVSRGRCALNFSGLTHSNVWKSILLGQLISLLLCSSAVLCQILVDNYNVRLPAAQSLLSYLLLASVYFGLLAGKSRAGKSLESVSVVFRRRGLRYLALALVDVEATYLMQRAMQYTTLVSIQLLDCFSIPTVLVLSWLLVKSRYRLTHIGGMALALMSVVAIVWIDVDDGKGGVGEGGRNRLIGDMMTLSGAFLSGISFVGLEHAVRYYDPYEFLGFVGIFGSIITVIQIAVLERSELLQLRWDLWEVSVLLLAFGVAQFVRVSCLHVMIRLSSAAGLNLALLATDFYAVMAGITFFHYKFSALYFLPMVLVGAGVLLFSIQPVPLWSSKKDSEIFCSSSSGSVGSGMNMASSGGGGGGTNNNMFSSSMQSSQTTVFGGHETATMTLAEVEFNSVPPDATMLPNVEVHKTMVGNGLLPRMHASDTETI